MLAGQCLLRPEGVVRDTKGQVPLQASVEFVHTYNAQAHELVEGRSREEDRARRTARSGRSPAGAQ